MKKNTQLFSKIVLVALMISFGFTSCKNNTGNAETSQNQESEAQDSNPFFKISLAQWSLNGPMRSGEIDPLDFAQVANEMGFEGIEYVSQLYTPHLQNAGNNEEAMQNLLDTLKTRSERYNVENLLIMVDGEGDLASPREQERNQAVDSHKKWVDAASYLGAHSIRVNLFGSDEPEIWKPAAVDGLTKLSEYAATKNVNVLVENHGYLSSNAALLVEVMEGVNLPNCGTLPDFGNFCLKREGGERWEASCVEEYDKYQGVEELMPFAKAVSAKSYEFNDQGQETTIDYNRMLQIVKDAGYNGYIGIEYEGQKHSPKEGIIATKELLIAEGTKLNQ